MSPTARRAALPIILFAAAWLATPEQRSAWNGLGFMALFVAWVLEIRAGEDEAVEPPIRADTAAAIVIAALWIGREGVGGALVISAIALGLLRSWLARAARIAAALEASFRASAPAGPCVVVLEDAGHDVVGVTRLLSQRFGQDVAEAGLRLARLPHPVTDTPMDSAAAMDAAVALTRAGARCAVRPA
jgi:hypothetical protein